MKLSDLHLMLWSYESALDFELMYKSAYRSNPTEYIEAKRQAQQAVKDMK